MDHQELINLRLQRIARILLINSGPMLDIGLLNGKLGIAIFFYYYSAYIQQDNYHHAANELLLQITERLPFCKSQNYVNGIAGIGAGINYLFEHKFIEGDQDQVFEAFDTKLWEHTKLVDKRLDIWYGISGVGIYFASRVKNGTIGALKSHQQNIEYLNLIIEKLSIPYNSYKDLISVINFLMKVFPLEISTTKVKHYLYYAADKLETMAFEDDFFQVPIPVTYQEIAYKILAISCLLQDESLQKNALRIFNYFDKEEYSADPRFHDLIAGTSKYISIYGGLYDITKQEFFLKKREQYSNLLLLGNDSDGLSGYRLPQSSLAPSMGLLGICGIGLTLLTMVTPKMKSAVDLVYPF